jgi:multiple sugar transport system substrate-binding protein
MKTCPLSRRAFLTLSATTVMGALAAACVPVAPQPGAAEGAAGPSAAPIEIRVSAFGDVPDKNINDRTAAAVAEAYPHLKMIPETYVGRYYDKAQVNFAGGTAPDLFYAEGYRWQPFVDVVIALDEYIERDNMRAAWPDVHNYDILTTWNGQTHISIIDTGCQLMFYNKTLFDQAGVPYPTDDWTWSDFTALVPALTREEGATKYFGYSMTAGGWLGGYGWWISVIRKDGKLEFDTVVEPHEARFTQPEIVEALQFESYDVIANGWAPTPGLVQGGGISVATDRVAMGLQGPWYLPQCKGPQAVKEGGISFDVVLPPAGSAGSTPDAEIQGHMLTKASQHPDEAWEVMKFWMGEEVAQITAEEGRMCGTPELTDKYWVPIATEKFGFENAAAFVKAQLNGHSPMIGGAGANYDVMTGPGGPLAKARDAMFGLEKTAEEALAEANPEIQRLLDEYWAKKGGA